MRSARLALGGATSDNIIELCKRYLALLLENRADLYKLPDTLGIGQWSGPFMLEDTGRARKAIRAMVESATLERNRVELLLRSFTTVSGYEAVGTLNRVKYKGRDDWELSAGGAGFDGDRMTVQAVVDVASRIRCEEHIAENASSACEGRTTRLGISYSESLR